MTIKEFANEVTAEFEESKMIPAPLVEDNLLLVLDNFDSLNEYIEQDVLSALLHRMDKLTGDYKEIIDLFFEKQRRNLAEIEPVQETVTSENGKLHTVQAPNVKMTTIDNVEEKEPDWLITNYIPRYQITSLAGDGGSGKTTVWCALAAAISSGSSSFLTEEMISERQNRKRSCSFRRRIPQNIPCGADFGRTEQTCRTFFLLTSQTTGLNS